MSDPFDRTVPGEAAEAGGPAEGVRECPWCSAVAGPADARCPKCGAALAQRESIGGLVIPGVTDLDPAVRHAGTIGAVAKGQRNASYVNLATVAGGPTAGLVVGAAMLAPGAVSDLFGTGPNIDKATVGEPSPLARLVADRLDRGEPAPGDAPATPGDAEPPDEPPTGW